MLVMTSQLISALERFNYRLFEGELNLNLIGIRHRDAHANSFNDVFCALYQRDNQWVLEQFACTTDPGTYYRHNPLNVKGTAMVVPGQYRSLWTFGKHQGKYAALVQNKPITVYRDNNKDAVLDTNVPTETGFFGINCHRASQRQSFIVDSWSAGCQVIAKNDHFSRLISICKASSKHYGNTFTYTLLKQQQLEETR